MASYSLMSILVLLALLIVVAAVVVGLVVVIVKLTKPKPPKPTTSVVPGWYPDPHDPSRVRYFDGQVWTQSTQPPQ